MAENRLTFEPGRWYAMTMYPGYDDKPYHSPIEVHAIQLLGDRCFSLTFYNAGYAAGLRLMDKVFKILRRQEHVLIVEEMDAPSRVHVFERLTIDWVSAFAPGFGTMMIEAMQQARTLNRYALS